MAQPNNNNKQTPKAAPAPERKLTKDEIAAEKSARFRRIASGRASQVTKALKLLENCSNRAVYDYTPEQVDKMFSIFDAALTKCRAKFEEKKKDAAPTKVEL